MGFVQLAERHLADKAEVSTVRTVARYSMIPQSDSKTVSCTGGEAGCRAQGGGGAEKPDPAEKSVEEPPRQRTAVA